MSRPREMRRRYGALGVLIVVVPLAVAQLRDDAGHARLTPAEITTLPTQSAGAGTSGIGAIRTTVLSGDPTAAGPYAIALHVPPNTSIAAHRHRDARLAVVVSGTWGFGYGDVAADAALKQLSPGSFYTEPADVMHFAHTGSEPAVVYIFGNGPTDTQYADAAADPRR